MAVNLNDTFDGQLQTGVSTNPTVTDSDMIYPYCLSNSYPKLKNNTKDPGVFEY